MIAPRPTRCTGIQSFGATRLRTYEIAVPGTTLTPVLLQAARPLIEEFTGSVPGGTGFVIYHRARPANFVLAHLWDGPDLMQRYWTSPLHDPASLTNHREGAIGCLWELPVICAERDPWAMAFESPSAADQYLTLSPATS